MNQLHKRNLREIVAAVHAERLTRSQTVRACAERIDALEPRVQAWAHLDIDRARALANEGAPHDGVLAGAPVAIKDIIDVAGMPTRYGSQIYASAPTAPETAECATPEETGSPVFCTIWTLLGVPAITIPVGLGAAGLPLGLQIVCPAFEDDRALSIAAWCESHLPFPRVAHSPLRDARFLA